MKLHSFYILPKVDRYYSKGKSFTNNKITTYYNEHKDSIKSIVYFLINCIQCSQSSKKIKKKKVSSFLTFQNNGHSYVLTILLKLQGRKTQKQQKKQDNLIELNNYEAKTTKEASLEACQTKSIFMIS